MQFYGMALENDPAYLAAGKSATPAWKSAHKGRAGLLPNIAFQYRNGRNRSEVTQPTFSASRPPTAAIAAARPR